MLDPVVVSGTVRLKKDHPQDSKIGSRSGV